MGNRLCKKKGDLVDGCVKVQPPMSPPPPPPPMSTTSPFDRIIHRLHLKPNSWKSELPVRRSNNNQHVIPALIQPISRCDSKRKNHVLSNGDRVKLIKQLPTSNDWTGKTHCVANGTTKQATSPPSCLMLSANSRENGKERGLVAPVAPPRTKHKRRSNGVGIREKLEQVASRGLQFAFPKELNSQQDMEAKQELVVDEPVCVKRVIRPSAPADHDCNPNRRHHHDGEGLKNEEQPNRNSVDNVGLEHSNRIHTISSVEPNKDYNDDNSSSSSNKSSGSTSKMKRRRKNLSVISLPNYTDLKWSVASGGSFDDYNASDGRVTDTFDRSDSGGTIIGGGGRGGSDSSTDVTASKRHSASQMSLPRTVLVSRGGGGGGGTGGRLEACMVRCRSFGSLLPHNLLDKWRPKAVGGDWGSTASRRHRRSSHERLDDDGCPDEGMSRIVPGSDDSLGALEDWDLAILEHYNPKEASLPRRPRRPPLQSPPSLTSNTKSLNSSATPSDKSELKTSMVTTTESDSVKK